jgi:hypothetical protein
MMWEWIKRNQTSVIWFVLAWMVTVLVLLVIGPVWRP